MLILVEVAGPARAGVSKAHDSGDLGGDLGPPLYEEDLEYLEREECQSERQIERYRAAEVRHALWDPWRCSGGS